MTFEEQLFKSYELGIYADTLERFREEVIKEMNDAIDKKAFDFIENSISLIKQGIAKKVEADNISIYSVGKNLIRIDIKTNIE